MNTFLSHDYALLLLTPVDSARMTVDHPPSFLLPGMCSPTSRYSKSFHSMIPKQHNNSEHNNLERLPRDIRPLTAKKQEAGEQEFPDNEWSEQQYNIRLHLPEQFRADGREGDQVFWWLKLTSNRVQGTPPTDDKEFKLYWRLPRHLGEPTKNILPEFSKLMESQPITKIPSNLTCLEAADRPRLMMRKRGSFRTETGIS
ncbi:hypothetical protein C8R44DRAFT_741602 [Mycena epipterygia]|nr:hypothetical protein C8R44DRAFT_741602 [Mycena epipterygia]